MSNEFLTAGLYWIKTFNEKVKEKSWVIKLLNLLNEFETPQSWVVFNSYDSYDGTFYWVDCDWETEIAWSDAYVFSNRFQFISRLIEQNKIDIDKLEKAVLKENLIRKFDEWLLMILAIKDEPIRFLISILK